MKYPPKMPRSPHNFRFSKSSFLTYMNCPYQFKLSYIDAEKPSPNPYAIYADIGTNVHKQIEDFYTDDIKIRPIEPDDKEIRIEKGEHKIKNKKIIINKPKYYKNSHMKNFIKLQERLIKDIDYYKRDVGYLKPIEQEYDACSSDLNIHGFIDAAYINYEDDGVIILDWKTGKIKDLDSMREEVAFYALCWNGDKELVDKYGPVKYWGMYYTKTDYMFLEEADYTYLRKLQTKIIEQREMIEKKFFPKTLNPDNCRWCRFKKKCGGYLK